MNYVVLGLRKAWRVYKNSSMAHYAFVCSLYLGYVFGRFAINRVYGNPNRIIVHPSAKLCNATLNTMSGCIKIGPNAFCGQNVCILTGTHDRTKFGEKRLYSVPNKELDINIGEGVWLCSNVTLLGPCSIGMHSVVAAGAVVIAGTVIPPYSVYGGIPAKLISMIVP